MRLLRRVIEWHLGRHLTSEQLAFTLGDLDEDLAWRERTVGTRRAAWWLVRETLSVSAAYRLAARGELRLSRRTIMGTSWMDDARFAVRRLVKRPGASLASVLTLACAIGAGAATWSLLSSLLLHPLPVESPEHLVYVAQRFADRDGRPGRISQGHVYPVYLAVRESGVFEGIAAGGTRGLLVGSPGEGSLQPRTVYFASHDYFHTLGVRLQRGRDFTAVEDRRGAPLAVIISDQFWRTVLKADPDVVGRTLTVGKALGTIVGVAPRRFRGLSLSEAPDIYVPLHAVRDAGDTSFNAFAESRTAFINPSGYSSPSSWIAVVGRLRPGTSVEQAVARLNGLPIEARGGRPFELVAVETNAIPEAAHAGMIHFTRLLALTVGLLLLIGCLTVGTLLLVRTEARRDEFAVCLALGGSRFSLARGIVFEGALISLAGLVCAIPIASWLFASARTFELPGGIAVDLLQLSIDRYTWLGIAGCAAAAMLAIAVVAGVFGFSPNVADVLRSRAGATPRVTRRRTRATLVVAQVAVALVLVAGAGVLTRSLIAALTVNPGFDASRIVTGRVSLSPFGYGTEQAAPFFDELGERLRRSPAVASVSFTQSFGSMSPGGEITVDGVPRQFPSSVSYTAIDERYFSTMGLPIVAGRDFTPQDTMRMALVVIVSESLGRALANGGNPLGHRITEISGDKDRRFAVAEVVGVVPDVITDVNATEPLSVYYSLTQKPASPNRVVVLNARLDARGAMRDTLATIKQMNPLIQPEPMLTIEERLGRQMSPQRMGGFVLGALGVIAILLTVLGAYVLAESMAATRRREFGIRGAFGASRLELGTLVLAETVRLVGAGLLAGLILAWMGANTIRTFLFRVEPLDPATLAAVSAAILALALIVSLRPAVKSASVDLANVLREE
jgi:putative ABC transport system permease protein